MKKGLVSVHSVHSNDGVLQLNRPSDDGKTQVSDRIEICGLYRADFCPWPAAGQRVSDSGVNSNRGCLFSHVDQPPKGSGKKNSQQKSLV